MNRHRRPSQPIIVAGVLAVMGAAGIEKATAQPDGEFKAVMRIETPGEAAMDMVYFLRGNQLRMDVSEQASIVWTSGADATMLMIQHPQKQYMEWGPDQLRMMQQMLGRIPGGGATAGQDSDFGPAQVMFEETGRRERIGDWDAFEVRMTMPDQPPGLLWLTTDIDTGLFELSRVVADAASALRMPMAGGGAPSAQELARYRALPGSQGLPDGQVVRIVHADNDSATQITLMSIMPGPLPADTFNAPADYNKMQMPSLPGGIPGGIPGAPPRN